MKSFYKQVAAPGVPGDLNVAMWLAARILLLLLLCYSLAQHAGAEPISDATLNCNEKM